METLIKKEMGAIMIKKDTQPFLSHPFCKLPFYGGAFKVCLSTINRHTDYRIPKNTNLNIHIRKIAFEQEVWTLAVTIDDIVERVYIKVTVGDLLVSCSTGTNESYLSRYAYCTIYQIMLEHMRTGFYDYYWPDLGVGKIRNRFLKYIQSKTGLEILSRDHLQGLFKPGQFLPNIEMDTIEIQRTFDTKSKKLSFERKKILSYNLMAAPLYNSKIVNHYPFLIPYQGTLNRVMNKVKLFGRHIFDYNGISAAFELTPEEKQLNEICFSMLAIAPIKPPFDKITGLSNAGIRQENIGNFTALLKLWNLAFPLLNQKRCTYYFQTAGMHQVTKRIKKNKLKPCSFNNRKAEICFSKEEHANHYVFDLYIKLQDGGIHRLPYHFDASFFVAIARKPRDYYLLNSVTDCNVLALFAESNGKISVLKIHYDKYFKPFEDQLRARYKFICE